MSQAVIEGYRMSPQQKRVWRLQNDSFAFRSQAALLLEGPLDTNLLRESVEQVCQRHEILRTTFAQLPGLNLPLQVVSERAALSYCEIDCSAEPQDAQPSLIDAYLAEQGRLGFDLEQGPVARLSVLLFSAERQALLITLPSLCADAETLKNFVREIIEAYEASLEGARPDDEPLQYAQFSEWQNELLEEESDEGREFWRQQQTDSSAIEGCQLPFEMHPGRLGQSSASTIEEGYAPATLSLLLSRESTARLEELATRHNVSEREVLLACWHILLWRLNDRQQVVVNALFDGRKHQELLQTFGLLAKYLPVRAGFKGDPTFTTLLRKINEASNDAEAWQEYYSRDEIVPGSTLPATTHAQHLSFGFDFLHWPEPLRLQSLRAAVLHLSCCAEQFKLRLSCVRDSQRDGGLKLEFHY
ncbi:MAG: condensation domain-containing protein, partial [Pyrinomonadaceae bacterium]